MTPRFVGVSALQIGGQKKRLLETGGALNRDSEGSMFSVLADKTRRALQRPVHLRQLSGISEALIRGQPPNQLDVRKDESVVP